MKPPAKPPDVEPIIPDLVEEDESTQELVRQLKTEHALITEPELTNLRAATIRSTKGQDWIEMGDKLYLQSTGVERAAPFWGLVQGHYTIARENYPDGEFAYIVMGPVASRKTGVVLHVEGGRSSRDPFFDAFDEERPSDFNKKSKEDQAAWKKEHRIKPDDLEVRKAAVTNWMCRGASMIAGIRGLTRADVEAMGVTGIKRIEYGAGAKGGQAVPADLKAEQVKLANEVLKRVGGDTNVAKEVMIDITSNPEKNFKGFDSASKLTMAWQITAAMKRLKAHGTFGDEAREPGADE